MPGVQILQALSGALYMLTITVVGVRLLILARRNAAMPELYLGLSLLVGGTLGASLEAGAMASAKELDPAVFGRLLLSGKLLGVVALAMQGMFVWKVFRPGAAWAPACVACLAIVSGSSVTGYWLHGTFTTGEISMPWFWLELFGRCGGSIWLLVEATRYSLLMRRRQVLGLADPIVTNRFQLFALAGVCGIMLMLTAVPPVVFEDSTHPMMALDLVAFSLFGIAFSIVYSLAFFPPARYVAWLEGAARGVEQRG